jgi:hypothetical protein
MLHVNFCFQADVLMIATKTILKFRMVPIILVKLFATVPKGQD